MNSIKKIRNIIFKAMFCITDTLIVVEVCFESTPKCNNLTQLSHYQRTRLNEMCKFLWAISTLLSRDLSALVGTTFRRVRKFAESGY